MKSGEQTIDTAELELNDLNDTVNLKPSPCSGEDNITEDSSSLASKTPDGQQFSAIWINDYLPVLPRNISRETISPAATSYISNIDNYGSLTTNSLTEPWYVGSDNTNNNLNNSHYIHQYGSTKLKSRTASDDVLHIQNTITMTTIPEIEIENKRKSLKKL